MSTRDAKIVELYRRRPVNRFTRWSGAALLAFTIWAWFGGTFDFRVFGTDRAARNLTRFLDDIRPYDLRNEPFDAAAYAGWLGDKLGPNVVPALSTTLAMSVAAIVLAAAFAAVLALPAARTWATPEPFLPAARPPSRVGRWAWTALRFVVRSLLIFVRSIPEYVGAFLFLPLVGLGPWPAVLALAVHNTGILGKLYAELVENADLSAARNLRGAGASRLQIAVTALAPAQLGRALLYLFYRWETCVREATVLGLLGFLSLGWFIQDARAGVRYDEMVHWVALGAALILVGDAVSTVVRRRLRNG